MKKDTLKKMKFDVIYADPAWNFETYSDKGKDRSAENHYQVMTLEDIKNLPVNDVTNKNCVLFMWVTNPLLKEGIEVGEAWGFKYKTLAFSWAKLNKKRGVINQQNPSLTDNYYWAMGNGYWTRANLELCLLFTKGKPKKRSHSVRQFLASPRMKHSKKPYIFHKRIERLIIAENRLELFARRIVPNWVCLGNEIDGRDLRDSLLDL